MKLFEINSSLSQDMGEGDYIYMIRIDFLEGNVDLFGLRERGDSVRCSCIQKFLP